MKKIGLIGPAYHEYKEELQTCINRENRIWCAWTYYHPPKEEQLIRDQLARDGFLYIYVLDTKNPSEKRKALGVTNGSGLVDYRLKVEEIVYKHKKDDSPDPSRSKNGIFDERYEKSCGWYLISKVDDKIPSKPWNSFIDYFTGHHLARFCMVRPNAHWVYIEDPY
jgi:hypothetical protein